MIRDNFRRQIARGVYICPITGVAVHDPSKKETRSQQSFKGKNRYLALSFWASKQDTLLPAALVTAVTICSAIGWVIYHQSPPSPPLSFQPAPPAPFRCAQSSGPDGCLFVIGGKSSSKFDGGEIFLQSFNGTHWLQETPLPKELQSQHGGGAAVLDGRLYVAGFAAPSTFLSYDGEKWRYETSLPSLRTGYAVVTFQGHVYVLGGYSWVPRAVGVVARVDRFTPATAFQAGTCSPAPPLLTARSGLAACVAFRRLYVLGGSYRNEVEYFDGEQWFVSKELPQRTTGLDAVFNAGRLFSIGGYSYGMYQESVQSFTGVEWNRENPMFAARAWHACTNFQDRIYCLGGDSSPIKAEQTYVPPDEIFPLDVQMQANATRNEVPEELVTRAMEYLGSDGFWRLEFRGFLPTGRNRIAMVAYKPP